MPNVPINSICLQVNKWTDPKTPDWPLIELLPKIKTAGFSEVEAWGPHLTVLDAEGVSALATALDASGLEIPSVGAYIPIRTGQPLEQFWSAAGAYLTLCTDLGISMLRVFAGGISGADASGDDWHYATKLLATYSQEAAYRNVTVVAETHGKTLADTVEGALRLIESVNHLNFKLLFQSYDFGTETTLAQWEALKEHVTHVHLQNRDENGGFRPLADGTLDYATLIGQMAADGYAGDMVVEFTADCAPADAAAYDLEKVLAGAASDRQFALKCWEAAGG